MKITTEHYSFKLILFDYVLISFSDTARFFISYLHDPDISIPLRQPDHGRTNF